MTKKELAFYKGQSARGMFLDSLSIFLIGWKVLLLEVHTIHVCPLRIELFLLVFFILRLYSFLYNLFTIVIYVVPKKTKRSSKISTDFFFFYTQIIFQLGWFIYGNTIVYTKGYLKLCYEPEGSHFAAILVMVLVMVGYILMTIFIF